MERQPLICVLLYCTWAGISALSQPPSIYVQPSYNVFFKEGEAVEMKCVAKAIPNAIYTWKRNEIDFNPSSNDGRMLQLPNVGTIVIDRPEERDEGIFQCLATNDFGVSASILVNLREAKLAEFQVSASITHRPLLGAALTLQCVSPPSIPPAEVYWIVKETDGMFVPVVFDARVTLDHEYRLRITNVKPEDQQEGKAYACMAVNPIVRMSTPGPDNFIVTQGATEEQRPVTYMWTSPSDHFGLRGEPFRIKCIFAGNPTPDVRWTRTDGKALPDKAYYTSFGQELVFPSLEFSDEGDYECWATNILSQVGVRRTISIRVESRPYWIEEPKDLELVVGQSAHFKCLANGVPEPNIFWYINNVPLGEISDPRIDLRFKLVSPHEIMFVNVTLNDAMVIQCNVTNKHGYIWGDVYLNVLAEAPTILVPPEDVTVVAESQSVNLTCRTYGKPDPQITWLKENSRITDGRYRTLINGDLHIESIVMSDTGNFSCVAVNEYGSQNASGILIVRRKTQVEEQPLDLEVNAGNNATFTCSATTDPDEVQNLKMYWMKDNKNITEYDIRMVMKSQNNSLTIIGAFVRDSGNYTCIATNGIDNATATAMLTVKDRPDQPYPVSLEICEKGKATIRWTPGSDNHAPTQYFIVQYNTSFTPDQWINAATIDSHMNNATLSLSPYANYTFRVLAYNELGESKPSFPTLGVCRTEPATPLKHPDNVRTIGDKKYKLHVKWNPMPKIDQNGPGFKYVLLYKRRGSDDGMSFAEHIDDWRRDEIEVHTADVYRAYDIILRAQNALGEATQEAKVVMGYSGEDVPLIVPSDLKVTEVEATNATISWNFDMDVVGREDTPIQGEFKGFKVQVWRRNLPLTTMREWNITAEMVEMNRVGNQIYATIDNLLPNTSLEAQVAVMNNFYIGPPSNITEFQTKEAREAPTILVPPADVVVVAESQSVNLTCRTTGYPEPQITWFRENSSITNGRYRTQINGDLHIESVILIDAGNFSCMATNEYGSQNASGILIVRRKTQIEERPLDLEVNAGNNATFICTATTDPEEVQNLKMYWIKNGNNITKTDIRMIMNHQSNSLTIIGTIVRDSGNYTCIVTNGIDNATASALLTVKDRPDQPYPVSLETCDQGNATIRWTPGSDNHAPTQYFIVQYNTSFTPDQWINAATIESHMNNATLSLSPYANYTFRVLAYNKIGESDPSIPTERLCRTTAARPFKHPDNVRTIGDKKNKLHIKWTAMPRIQQNGPGFQYILQFKRRGDDERSKVMVPIDHWRKDSMEFNTGDVYRAYEIVLTARNSVGEAKPDAKMTIGYSGEDIPNIVPTDLKVTQVEATNATLSWKFDMNAPRREDTPIQGEFKGFKVQVWRRNFPLATMREWNITAEMVEKGRVGNQIYATIDNLLPNTSLEAQVAVMNNFFVGPPSNITEFQTKETPEAPTILVPPADVTVVAESQSVNLTCRTTGYPDPQISWFKENSQIDDGRYRTLSNGDLRIESLELSDSGNFSCVATNEYGSQKASGMLIVRRKTYIEEQPLDLEVNAGNNATFTCSATTDPEEVENLKIYWMKDNSNISINDNRMIQHNNNNSFTIIRTTVKDSGTYTCIATNGIDDATASAKLTVKAETPAILVPPAFLAVVAENQSVNLTCRTIGIPDPQITWFKENIQINDGRYQTLINGDLHIESVVLSDTGNFSCVATNEYGSQNASGMLIVRGKTQIDEQPLDLEVNAGNNATFTCSATTDPEEVENLKIYWMKDNSNISINDNRMIQHNNNNSFTIIRTTVKDSGTYTCIATNGIDDATASVKLTVKDLPYTSATVSATPSIKFITTIFACLVLTNSPVLIT